MLFEKVYSLHYVILWQKAMLISCYHTESLENNDVIWSRVHSTRKFSQQPINYINQFLSVLNFFGFLNCVDEITENMLLYYQYDKQVA